MKHLYTILLLLILHSVWIPEKIISANDNQLITEIKVCNNDSTFRYLYIYDIQGNKVIESKYFQQDSIWIRKSLNEWLYSGNRCIGQRERIWNNDQWLVSYAIDYGYNNENVISELHTINKNGIFDNLKKIEFQYTINTLTSKKEYVWLIDKWTLSIQTDFKYLQNGQTDSIKTTIFPEGTSNQQLLSTFTYNLKEKLKSQLFQEKSGTEWVNSSFINWYYLSDSITIASMCSKKWIADTSIWENTQRVDYQYNDNSDLSEESYLKWSTMFWKNDIRYDYQYDNHNSLIKKTLSQPIYNDWRGIISINYSNYTHNRANDIESKYEFWGGKTGELTTSDIPYTFNNETSVLKGRSVKISYIPVADSITDVLYVKNSIHLIPVYPNPSEGIFYMNTQEYTIKSWSVSSLSGQMLIKQKVSFQTGVIDITDFPKGIYILHVITQNEQLIQKLIKK